MRISAALCLPVVLLTGCSVSPTAPPTAERGLSLRGNVHGGQQPIIGAHVYLFAANTTGYGQPSVSTLSPSAPGAATDSIGTYVTTDTNGAFSISNDYTCTANTQLYLHVLGGDPGAGVNTAAGLLAVLGQCPASGSFASSVPFVTINEVTTVASAYAMAGFATDATHVSSSGTPLAQTGIANAFANASNLVDISAGAALTTTPAGNGTVPQTRINTLGNILAACINSTGPSSTTCSTLFSSAQSSGSAGTTPTDTATAAINIAHNPGSNVAALFALPTANAPFAPALTSQPGDLAILLTFTGGGLGNADGRVAIDQSGNAWVTNDKSVVELSSMGAILSGPSGYIDPNQNVSVAISTIAIDPSESAWVTNPWTYSVTKFSASGSVLSGSNGFPVGTAIAPGAIAFDGLGDAWIGAAENVSQAGVFKLSNSGTNLSGTYGYQGGGLNPGPIAIDGSGNVWTANGGGSGSVTKLSNSGTILSGPNGYTGGGQTGIPDGLAIDSAGDVWIASRYGNVGVPGGITKFSNSGSVLLTANGFGGNGVSASPQGIAIDGASNVWVTNQWPTNGIVELSSSGAVLFQSNAYAGGGTLYFPTGIAVDGSGNIWVADEHSDVLELIGAATPVITPIVAGLPQTPTTDGTSKLGTRP